MKIVLGVLAILGFGLEGIAIILGGLEYWPENAAPDGEHIFHVLLHIGYLAGCVAGMCLGLAVCLGYKPTPSTT